MPDTDRDFFIITADLHVQHMNKYQRAGIGDRVFFDTFSRSPSCARYVSEDMGNTGFRNMNGCGVMWKWHAFVWADCSLKNRIFVGI